MTGAREYRHARFTAGTAILNTQHQKKAGNSWFGKNSGSADPGLKKQLACTDNTRACFSTYLVNTAKLHMSLTSYDPAGTVLSSSLGK